jgi:phosphoribosylcarboxyaminoimidazole (NCAIR) mutase
MSKVIVILGSPTDEDPFFESEADKILGENEWEMSTASAHRNPGPLARYCRKTSKAGAFAYICAMGLDPALPGGVQPYVREDALVIGVPLPSSGLDGPTALVAMTAKPQGSGVLTAGFGKTGLQNAVLKACAFVARSDDGVLNRLKVWNRRFARKKKPGFDFDRWGVRQDYEQKRTKKGGTA